MSSRALRKAQREREEHDRLQKLEHSEEDDEEDIENDDGVQARPATKSAFAMLGDEGEDEGAGAGGGAASSGEEENDHIGTQPAQASISKSSAKKKKKKKKPKSGGTAARDPSQSAEMDDIDKALEQLATNGNAAQAGGTAAGVDAAINETNSLLAIDTSHLHAQNEMRRLFGRAALEQEAEGQPAADGQQGGNRRQQRRGQQGGLAQALRGQGGAGGRSGGLAAMALRRNIFIQGKEDWPVATGGGLGMEIEKKLADGTILYRFLHNRAYQDVQAQFETCVESMDPDRLVMLLRNNPYHISTLLQVSEIAKQEGDHATSGDLLERALFSFGRAVHSSFAKTLSEGRARLDFARQENREFWLASWRYMQNLSMRATWRTVYEWAKLLLSFAPEEDPYAMWLVLDQYALRSRQDLDYLNISRNSSFRAAHGDAPHVQLSQGLTESRAGNKSKGKQALFTAVARFPWVVTRMMQELSIDPPPAIWGKESRTEKEKLYSELYATRAKDLWNTPETAALLTEVAAAVQSDTPSAAPDTDAITTNEARHVLLSDTPALIALLPRKFTARLTSASDPLPPDNSIPSYLADRPDRAGRPTRGVVTSRASLHELQGLIEFFTNLFPWFSPAAGENAGQATGIEGAAVTDVDGTAVDGTVGGGAVNAGPSPEDIERRIRESGASAQVIVDRMQRMRQLQQNLVIDLGEDHGQDVAHLAALGVGMQDADAHLDAAVMREGGEARVEDAPEED
ncbi:hypothetical protein LTR08_003431 [Meristemomyces frigidus]|nr:hypothetical protein LTR08_003431 [Meristemomyces frigidus]